MFGENTLIKIQKVRKAFLWVAVWILIAELIGGAILILTGSQSVIIGKIQLTFLVLALILFVGVNNFIRIEKGDRTTQCFAIMSFACGLIWGILASVLIWEIVPFTWIVESMGDSYYRRRFYSVEYHLTGWAISMLIASYTAGAGFWISNVLAITETVKSVKPLKITAVISILYLWVFGTVVTLMEPEFEDVQKFAQLAGLASLAFVVTAATALIISVTSKGKDNKSKAIDSDGSAELMAKTEAELRAEIEEKVRREMIEKEVRERLGASQPSVDGPKVEKTEEVTEEETINIKK